MIILNFPFKLISKDNFYMAGRGRRFYLPSKYREFENKIKLFIKQQYKGKILEGNLSIEIIVNFKNKVHADTCNLFKGINDALQGFIYLNDKQIKTATISISENSPEENFTVIIEVIS